MALAGKLAPHFAWLFAAATLGATIGITYLLPLVVDDLLMPQQLAGVYFVICAAGAYGAMVFTAASTLYVIGSFAAAALGLGVFYEAVAVSDVGALLALEAVAAAIAGAMLGRKVRRGWVQPPALLHKAKART